MLGDEPRISDARVVDDEDVFGGELGEGGSARRATDQCSADEKLKRTGAAVHEQA